MTHDDLLEAAKNALRWLERPPGKMAAGSYLARASTAENLRAAIAKAEAAKAKGGAR